MYLITDREAVRSSRLWVGSCRNLPLMTGCDGCKSLGRVIDGDARTFTVRSEKYLSCVWRNGANGWMVQRYYEIRKVEFMGVLVQRCQHTGSSGRDIRNRKAG